MLELESPTPCRGKRDAVPSPQNYDVPHTFTGFHVYSESFQALPWHYLRPRTLPSTTNDVVNLIIFIVPCNQKLSSVPFGEGVHTLLRNCHRTMSFVQARMAYSNSHYYNETITSQM